MNQLKTILLLAVVVFAFSCQKENKKENSRNKLKPFSKEMIASAIIYEANIRQYSKEGTFDAFTKDVPELKKLGVKIIWLMPVFPISKTKRKATGGEFANLIKDPEKRKKMLGSYYAVSDFTKINPEFGTINDFRELVKKAHENDMYVILDWVPNHTGWDHEWLKNHPEYYTQNEKGEIIHPEGTDWTDVADLNYSNLEMRKEMIADMKYWITQEKVDGFRCDVAGSVPLDFWQESIPQLRKEKSIFMLAEAWEPELMKEDLFDMVYGWGRHHTMNRMSKGANPVKDWNENMKKDIVRYEKDDILMTFVTNHDENSWNGTVSERMGKAAEALTVLGYVAPGMPLIYSGQEYNLDHRLKFFEKDSIPKKKKNMWYLLEKLGKLKANNSALNSDASYKSIIDDGDVLVIQREKSGKKLIYIANLSDENQKIKLPYSESFVDYLNEQKIQMKDEVIELAPWEYKIVLN